MEVEASSLSRLTREVLRLPSGSFLSNQGVQEISLLRVHLPLCNYLSHLCCGDLLDSSTMVVCSGPGGSSQAMKLLVFLVVLQVLNVAVAFECPRGINQAILPDPKDCRKYYHCLNDGRVFHQYCARGLVFDPKTSVCVWDSFVSCIPLDALPVENIASVAQAKRSVDTKASTENAPKTTAAAVEDPTTSKKATSDLGTSSKTDEPSTIAPEVPAEADQHEEAEAKAEPEQAATESTTVDFSTATSSGNTTDSVSNSTDMRANENPTDATESVETVMAETSTKTPGVEIKKSFKTVHKKKKTVPKHSVLKRSPFDDNTIENGIKKITCPSAFSYVADPDDCHTFYHCNNWRPFQKRCPPGLFFDSVTLVCNWPHNVNCIDGFRAKTYFAFNNMKYRMRTKDIRSRIKKIKTIIESTTEKIPFLETIENDVSKVKYEEHREPTTARPTRKVDVTVKYDYDLERRSSSSMMPESSSNSEYTTTEAPPSTTTHPSTSTDFYDYETRSDSKSTWKDWNFDLFYTTSDRGHHSTYLDKLEVFSNNKKDQRKSDSPYRSTDESFSSDYTHSADEVTESDYTHSANDALSSDYTHSANDALSSDYTHSANDALSSDYTHSANDALSSDYTHSTDDALTSDYTQSASSSVTTKKPRQPVNSIWGDMNQGSDDTYSHSDYDETTATDAPPATSDASESVTTDTSDFVTTQSPSSDYDVSYTNEDDDNKIVGGDYFDQKESQKPDDVMTNTFDETSRSPSFDFGTEEQREQNHPRNIRLENKPPSNPFLTSDRIRDQRTEYVREYRKVENVEIEKFMMKMLNDAMQSKHMVARQDGEEYHDDDNLVDASYHKNKKTKESDIVGGSDVVDKWAASAKENQKSKGTLVEEIEEPVVEEIESSGDIDNMIVDIESPITNLIMKDEASPLTSTSAPAVDFKVSEIFKSADNNKSEDVSLDVEEVATTDDASSGNTTTEANNATSSTTTTTAATVTEAATKIDTSNTTEDANSTLKESTTVKAVDLHDLCTDKNNCSTEVANKTEEMHTSNSTVTEKSAETNTTEGNSTTTVAPAKTTESLDVTVNITADGKAVNVSENVTKIETTPTPVLNDGDSVNEFMASVGNLVDQVDIKQKQTTDVESKPDATLETLNVTQTDNSTAAVVSTSPHNSSEVEAAANATLSGVQLVNSTVASNDTETDQTTSVDSEAGEEDAKSGSSTLSNIPYSPSNGKLETKETTKKSFISLSDLIKWYLRHWRHYSRWKDNKDVRAAPSQ